MQLRFTKMHGIGNDYIYVDGLADARVRDMPATELRDLAVAVSDRHRGVGSDGLILILPPGNPASAELRMRMFNADGSESEMCGNGIRCVAKYAIDRGLSRAKPVRVETGAGVLSIDYTLDARGNVDAATVDMGPPALELQQIPVDATKLGSSQPPVHGIEVRSRNEIWAGTFISMGNPHAVFYFDDNPQLQGQRIEAVELDRLGPLIEHHPAFPRRVNAHIVHVVSRGEVRMRTWERGAGLTLACGTGACAVCVAGVINDKTNHDLLVHLPGGDLQLRWAGRPNDHVFMTGPAVEVFSGEWNMAGISGESPARAGSVG